MKAVPYILLGAGLTSATSLALGLILFRALSIRLRRGEERLLAFVTGSALLSGIVFILCCTGLVRKGVFVTISAAALLGAYRLGAHRPAGEPLQPIPSPWKWLAGLVFATFTVLYFFNSMAPEMSPDGTAYHLVFPAAYYKAHRFVRVPWNMYSNLTQGVEMLFLFAFAFGKHSAAALVHFSFLATLPWLMIAYARRFASVAVGVAGGMFFFASPVVGIDGASAYVDVALAAILFALFYLLQIWDAERDARLLIPIGILAGFSVATKYTAFLAVPYTLGFVLWKLYRARQPLLRPTALLAGLALLFIAPWLAKNWIYTGNPLSPFANALFPNPYVHIAFEEEYRKYQRVYGLTSWKQIPWEVTVNGVILGGALGPLYLLTPLALLALRFPAGRQLLLAGALFAVPYLSNVGTRFLIPCAPFVSLALAMAFMNWPWLLAALLLAHSVSCWPDAFRRYGSPYAWRLEKIPVLAALRIEPEDAFLSRRFSGYVYDRAMDRSVAPGGQVFSFGQIAEAYTTRRVLVKYLAAPNETLGDIMWTPLYPDLQPSVLYDFRFAPREVRKLRAVKTKDMGDAQWNVSEFRVFDRGSELARAPHWRLTAKPNPWDVQLAFDNSPVTRWRSWENGKAGMFLEIDFGGLRRLDAARIETQPDWREPDITIEGLDATGHWAALSSKPDVVVRPITVNLRRAATAELKARGIRYVMVGYDDIGSEDFQQHAAFWGLKPLADAGYSRLYYIE